MRQLIFTLLLLLISCGQAFASDSLFVRLEQPKTPTNDQDFPITFVVLDTVGNRNINVVCEKQYESEAVSQFYSTTISANGNTGSCLLNSSIVDKKGNYQITVRATAETDSSSETVSFSYNSDAPETPRDYSKNKIDNCKYEIKFKTADDGGKTTKVEIYRSDTTSFKANDDSRITEIGMSSNTEKSYQDTAPECNKTYYYAVRAFSNSGNGSGLAGDKEIKIIEETSNETQTNTTQAIAVSGRGGSVLGVTKPVNGTAQGEVLGIAESTQSATLSADEAGETINQDKSKKKWYILGVVAAVGAGLVWFFGKKSSDQ